MVNVDEIRKEIAVKHDILLPENDSSLVLVTMVDSLLTQYVDDLNKQQEENVKALINAVQQGIAEGKKTAKEIITKGADYVSNEAHTAVVSAMDEGREQVRKDLILAVTRIEEARIASARWAAVSSLCAAITVGAMLAHVF